VTERSAAAARLTAAALGLLFAGFATLYGWQAWRHGTPIIFTDELELTQLSRSIAETGHAARRGEPYSFTSLVTYLWAPFWWIDDVKTAYTAIKLANVAIMTSALFPAYFLARLVASRPAALFAAAGTAAIPALSYSPLLLEEPLAYPWAALSLFLTTKAIVARTRGWLAAAAVVAATGPLVRGQLGVLVAAFVLAVLFMAATGTRARRELRRWSRWDWAGVAMLALGALIVVNATLSSATQSWEIPTRLYKGRIFDLGFQAGAHFAIGLGLLPVVAGLAVLLSFREARSPERRAFASVGWAALVGFSVYTGIKAAFLSTKFATLVEERNLIYLAPVLFAATAIWLDRPRLRLTPAVAAIGFVAFLLVWKPYQLGYGYFEAPGNGIPALMNRRFIWDGGTIRAVMIGCLAFCAVAVLLPVAGNALRRPLSETWVAAAGGMLAVLPLVVVAWCLTGEIYTASGFRHGANQLVGNLPKPLSWVDEATDGASATFIGQKITAGDALGINLDEFWNRSLTQIWSLDGTAPGPGRVQTPDLVKPDGTHFPEPGTEYVVAANGIQLAAPVVASKPGLRLYRTGGKLRVSETREKVYPDGWIGDEGGWSRFATPGGRPGTVVVSVSRAGFCGDAPVGHVTVRLGRLVIGPDRHPALADVRATRRLVLPNCAVRVVRLPSGPPPFQVEVRVTPTFRLSDYGRSDTRTVGAVVSFQFLTQR